MRCIFRIQKDKNNPYVIINKTIFSFPEISAKAKGVFCYLMTLPDDWQIRPPEIAKHFKEGRDVIYKCFKELESNGFIHKETKREKGKFIGYEYLVFETPDLKNQFLYSSPLPEIQDTVLSPLPEKPDTEKPDTEKPDTEKPDTEKPTLLYNNKPKNETTLRNDITKERSPKNGLRDVQLYFIESGIDDPLSNALKFFSHYEANGWVQGRGKPLKNWRAAPWASWNFIKTHSALSVRLIDQNNEYHIERFPREKILNGLRNGKVRVEDELYLVCNYIREIRESAPETILSANVKEILQRAFPGPS